MSNKCKYILIFFSFLFTAIDIPDESLENWTILNDTETWVGYKNHEGFPWCRSISELPFSIDKIVPIIDNFDNYSNIFLRINSSKKINNDIVYLKIGMPYFFSDRDYVVQYKSSKDNNIITYQWQSVKHPDAPVYSDIVRLPNAAGEWRLTPINDNLTRVSYSWYGELLGGFPSFYLSQAWSKQGVEIIGWLKEELKKTYD